MSVDNSKGSQIVNISAYLFVELKDLGALQADLLAICQKLSLKGTVLLAEEGINLNLAGFPDEIEQFCQLMRTDGRFKALHFKKSISSFVPFKRMMVKIKPEIITFRDETIKPLEHTVEHLSPKVLKRWLDEGKSLQLLDTRNAFEVEYGTFDGAKHIDLQHFSDMPAKLMSDLEQFDKSLPVVTFCTGGVRCEKAGPLLEKMGFREVYQLKDGILGYFEQCGSAHYRGDCFVFDERVAIDPAFNEKRKTNEYP